MDYPDPDEEYELMHAEEFELMNELDHDDIQLPPSEVPKPSSKRQLNFSSQPNDNARTGCVDNEYPSDEDIEFLQDLPGTAKEASIETAKGASNGNAFMPSNGGDTSSNTNKRTVENLFGDISDIELELSFPTKKQKLDGEKQEREARQEALIRTIIEERAKRSDKMKSSFGRKIVPEKTKKLEDCISTGSVPKWPFIPASVNGDRVYLRLHSEEKVKKDSKDFECSRGTGLLNVPFKELYKLAVEEMANKSEKPVANPQLNGRAKVSKDLWVEKYKPKAYLQLLSDEATNRSLLHWLKLWDKVVFNKEPKISKKAFPDVEKKDLLDEHHRPVRRVALLCGPPGLGKTTLAHMIAKQAGYCPVEMNASDDRSPQAFRTQLEAATQMKSVMGASPLPNCLILDEIDGAPQAAVEVLVKYATDKSGQKKGKKPGSLKRPIICICNDVHVPALRSLRQIAFTIVFPPTSSTRLSERLMEISKMEHVITDLGTMMVLSEKSNNDIRACLSILQYMKAKSSRITLSQVQSSTMGHKDLQQGLFSVWEAIFQIKLNKKGQGASVASKFSKCEGAKTNSPVYDVLRIVQSYGDYDRLAVGVFENYPKVRNTEMSLSTVISGLNWFLFHDSLNTYINGSQNYAVYGYLPWSFVAWHLLFASIQRPKLSYPSIYYDATSRNQKNRQILDSVFHTMNPKLVSAYQRSTILLDVTPLLLDIIVPNVRPVSFQLYTQKEKDELGRVVNVMADYNINYSQLRTPDGHYIYQLNPNIEELVAFDEKPKDKIISYTVKQLISKEVESETIRRSSAKTSVDLNPSAKSPPPEKKQRDLPNHLQRLTPKVLKKKAVEVQAKDFFGRVVEQSLSKVQSRAKTDDIVKSDIWFHFKEGYNNAVRRNVYISDLL